MVKETPDGYRVPIHRSLTETVLMMGVPRNLAIMNCTLGAAIGIMLKLYPLLILNIALHIMAVYVTRKDPLFFDALRRHLRQPKFFEV